EDQAQEERDDRVFEDAQQQRQKAECEGDRDIEHGRVGRIGADDRDQDRGRDKDRHLDLREIDQWRRQHDAERQDEDAGAEGGERGGKRTEWAPAGCVDMNCGRGWMPYRYSAASMTADVAFPGMPSVRVGIKLPPAKALSDASEAMIPTGCPLPKSDLSFAQRF